MQRQLYNAALEERIGAWRTTGTSITRFDQTKSLTIIRRDDPEGHGALPVATGRWTLRELDTAMKGFFSRTKGHGSAGFPRFRSYARWRTFGFAEWNGIRVANDRLIVKGFDRPIRINVHRAMPVDAVPKSASLTRKGGRWFVNIMIETRAIIEKHTGSGGALGVDAGVNSLGAFSDGILFGNARPGRKHAAEMRVTQRALARCRRGSRRRAKVKARLARQHERIADTRKTHLHRVSAVTARFYSTIVVEDLSLSNMVRSRQRTKEEGGTNTAAKSGLNRAILDTGMGKLIQLLTYKAERSGGQLIKVNARNTSQDCSSCGARVPKALNVRMHRCDACGLVLDRDVNAAKNILRRGRAKASEGV